MLWIGGECPGGALAEALAGRGFAVIPVASTELTAHLHDPRPVILCFGHGSSPDLVASALQILDERDPRPAHLALVVNPSEGAGGFQELLDEDRLFYVASGPLPAAEIVALLEAAVAELRRGRDAPAQRAAARAAIPFPVEPATLRRLALAQSAAEASEILSAAAAAASGAERGRCLLFDGEERALWSPGPDGEAPSAHSPAVGLASFVLRTGRPLCLPRVGEDHRFEPDLDAPEGARGDRYLAVPVRDPDGEPVAVLVALRPASREQFAGADIAALDRLALHAAPFLAAWAQAAPHAKQVAERGPFRERALSELEAPSGAASEPLRLTPAWTRGVYWLLLWLLAASVGALALVRLPEHAAGAAVVRAGNRVEVTALAAGVVSSITVAPGTRVEPGRTLLTLYHAGESARLERLNRELEGKLALRLQAPSDREIADDLGALRAERDLAAAELAERELKAPVAGVVRDLRAVPGQVIAPGQPVLSIVDGAELPSVVVLIPGQYLPQLRPGMKVRLELSGYPFLYQWLTLDSVAEEVTGPAEARRLLGPDAGDAVELGGPVALVTARLPAETFTISGERYPYRDGMLGRAEVRIRSERLLLSLVPGLRALGGQDG